MSKPVSFQEPSTSTSTLSPEASVKPYKTLPLMGRAHVERMYETKEANDMDEIVQNLYLGYMASASKDNLNELKAVGITHIICVRQEYQDPFVHPDHHKDIKYKVLVIDDLAPSELVIPRFKEAREFLNLCFESEGKALVYEENGSYGSTAVVASYVMSEYGRDATQAMEYIATKRFPLQMGDMLMNQLNEYEPIYRALHDNPNTPLQADSGQKKRPSSEMYKDEEEDEMDAE